ncbi:MAG: hypothetical protein ACR2Q3_08240 [Woeseiaceae bacterium]
MNGFKLRGNFFAKLSVSTVVLLLTQHAFAAGTTAGTPIENLATVSYEVNTVLQTVIESAPGVGNANPGVGAGTITTFVVDNRVNFTLAQVGSAHTTVNSGDSDAFVEFTLTNDGNSAQDFRMIARQLASTDPAVNTLLDTDVNLNNIRIRVASAPSPVVPIEATDLPYANEIPADSTYIVHVYGDADVVLGLVDGDAANLELSAVVAEAGDGAALGDDLDNDVSNPNTAAVENVFVEGGGLVLGDGIELAFDGFLVAGAGLTVTKIATVVSDPFNTADFKAIPGATVEYVITVANNGSLNADNVSIADAIDADIPAVPGFITGFYGGQDISVVNNGGAPLPCIADANPADGCTLVGQAITVGTPGSPITVTAGTSLVITYRVLIP